MSVVRHRSGPTLGHEARDVAGDRSRVPRPTSTTRCGLPTCSRTASFAPASCPAAGHPAAARPHPHPQATRAGGLPAFAAHPEGAGGRQHFLIQVPLLRTRVERRLPALSSLRGHRPAQEIRWPAVGKRDMSTPISANTTLAVRPLTPGIVASRRPRCRIGAKALFPGPHPVRPMCAARHRSPARCSRSIDSGHRRLGRGARQDQLYLPAQFLRIKARLGAKKAIFAVAASMLTAAYHMLRDGTEYNDLGADHFDHQDQSKTIHRLIKRLQGPRL